MKHEAASMTSSWTNEFIDQMSDREFRHAYMADQVRIQIAMAIRMLREQQSRKWSQTELGERCNKPQSWISKLEDPDYGKVSLQTLLDVAEAFDLPVLVQFPEWADWMRRTKNQSRRSFERDGFDRTRLKEAAVTSVAAGHSVATREFSSVKFAATAGSWTAPTQTVTSNEMVE